MVLMKSTDECRLPPTPVEVLEGFDPSVHGAQQGVGASDDGLQRRARLPLSRNPVIALGIRSNWNAVLE